jgi:hypothetical protein
MIVAFSLPRNSFKYVRGKEKKKRDGAVLFKLGIMVGAVFSKKFKKAV